MASLELKKQFVKEQLIAAHKVMEIQDKFRKVFFDEEKFALKEGIPLDTQLLETCLNIPTFKASILEIERVFNDIDLNSIEFVEIQRVISAGDISKNFTQIYIKYLRDIKNLKAEFSKYIDEMNAEYDNVTEFHDSESIFTLEISEKIKMFKYVKQSLCE